MAGFSFVHTSLLHLSKKQPNLFLPPLLIPHQTSRKAASSEGALFYGWLSSSPGAGTSSYASTAREVEVGDTALEEMAMQPCHGSHHHCLEHSDDQVIRGWKNWT